MLLKYYINFTIKVIDNLLLLQMILFLRRVAQTQVNGTGSLFSMTWFIYKVKEGHVMVRGCSSWCSCGVGHSCLSDTRCIQFALGSGYAVHLNALSISFNKI